MSLKITNCLLSLILIGQLLRLTIGSASPAEADLRERTIAASRLSVPSEKSVKNTHKVGSNTRRELSAERVIINKSIVTRLASEVSQNVVSGIDSRIVAALNISSHQEGLINNALRTALERLKDAEANSSKLISSESGSYIEVPPLPKVGEELKSQLNSEFASISGDRDVAATLLELISSDFNDFGQMGYQISITGAETNQDNSVIDLSIRLGDEPNAVTSSFDKEHFVKRYGELFAIHQ